MLSCLDLPFSQYASPLTLYNFAKGVRHEEGGEKIVVSSRQEI